MTRTVFLLIRILCFLDGLPRYGRIYSLTHKVLPELSSEIVAPSKRLRGRHTWTVRWEWRRRGFWGMTLMDKLNLDGLYWNLMLTEVDGLDDEEDDNPEDEEQGDDVSPAAQ